MDRIMETIVVTLWPVLHKRAEKESKASEAENAKQMSAYKHLLFPALCIMCCPFSQAWQVVLTTGTA